MLREWWEKTDPVVRDWWPVAAIAAIAALQQVGALTGDAVGRSILAAVLGLSAAVPLRWRVERPITVAIVLSLAVAAHVLLIAGDPPFATFIALMIVNFSTAAHLRMPHALAGPVLSAVPVGLMILADPTLPPTDLVFPLVYFGGAWGVGRLVRRRHETTVRLAELVRALEAEREENVRLAAEAERMRIAREVHDAVAHSLGVILIQSEAAGELLERDPAQVGRPLRIIGDTARESLDELRGVLGALRADQPTPSPTLDGLPDLVERFREAGVPTRLELDGLRDGGALPPGVEATTYRLVQESLTNVLRHARGASACVVVRRDPAGLHIHVQDDGTGVSTATGSSGFGLAGMRERVARHGGRLSAGPADGGGFGVDAVLPTGGTA